MGELASKIGYAPEEQAMPWCLDRNTTSRAFPPSTIRSRLANSLSHDELKYECEWPLEHIKVYNVLTSFGFPFSWYDEKIRVRSIRHFHTDYP